MKTTIFILLFVAPLFGFAQTNLAHRQALISTPPLNGPTKISGGTVPSTNLLAFQEYALDTLLQEANLLNEKWHLEILGTITSDNASLLSVSPNIRGMEGGVTINDRYRFGVKWGRFIYFNDNLYSGTPTPGVLETNIPTKTAFPGLLDTNLTSAEMIRRGRENAERSLHAQSLLAEKTNLLTKQTALEIARDALHKIGIYEKNLPTEITGAPNHGNLPRPEVTQSSFTDLEGKLHLLPHYVVNWIYPGNSFGLIEMEVSGVTKKVTHFDSFTAAPMTIPIPTNYYQMLHITPDKTKWGHSYDPLKTEAFEIFAEEAAVRQINTLVKLWDLDFQETITTNQIGYSSLTPRTNGFSYFLYVTNRFYVQGSEKGIDRFEDMANNLRNVPNSPAEVAEMMKLDKISKDQALKIARDALRKLGIDEKKLNLPQPQVSRGQFPLSDDSKLYDFPFYEVNWGDDSIPLGFVISGITKKVVFYVNGLETGPKISLPTNYPAILGIENTSGKKKQ